MWGLNQLLPVSADIAHRQVVAEHENNVRLFNFFGSHRVASIEKCRNQQRLRNDICKREKKMRKAHDSHSLPLVNSYKNTGSRSFLTLCFTDNPNAIYAAFLAPA